MAKLPAPSVNHYRVQSFAGGLNTNTDPSLLEDNEASDLLNVDFDAKGVVQKRPAVRVDMDLFDLFPANEVTGIYDFHRKNKMLERVYFHNLRSITGEYHYGVTTTYSDTLSDSTHINHLRFVDVDGETDFPFVDWNPAYDDLNPEWSVFTFNDKLYMMSYIFGLFVYEGVGSDNPDVIVKTETGSKEDGTDIDFARPCRHAVVHKNRVFYSGFPDDSDMLVFSELGNPVGTKAFLEGEGVITQQSAGGFIRIPSNDVAITGMGTFLEKLIIFKLNSAYVLSGSESANFVLDKINVNDGCINHNTIVLGNNYLYFLSPTGLNYLYSPDQQMIETSSLSDKIKDDLLEHDLSDSFSLFYSGKYYLFVPHFLYVYDETLKCWTKHDIDMQGGLVDKINQKILLYYPRSNEIMGGRVKSNVYTLSRDFLNDEYVSGEELAIVCRYQTRYFDFLEPELMKRLKFIKIFFLPTEGEGEMRLIQEINYRSQSRFVDTSYHSMTWGFSNWGESLWGASVDFGSKKVPMGGQGEYVRYTFVNDKLDQEFKIFSFIVGFKRKQKVR